MWPDLILDQETELTVTGHWCCVWVHKRHQGGKKEKENGRAIHRAGNHTINLTVFLSTACSLPFSFTNFEGEKKKRSFYSLSLFPPVDISSQSTDSLANSTPTSFTNSPSSSSFLPSSSSSCWQITLSSGTLFHLATPASLFLPLYFHTNCKPPSFPLQFSNEFHWHGLKKPIHLPLHHLSVFLFSVFLQRALLAPFNDSNSFALSLSLTRRFVSRPLLSIQTAYLAQRLQAL